MILSQNGSNLADYAGHIAIAKNSQESSQRSFDAESVQIQEARIASMQNRRSRSVLTLLRANIQPDDISRAQIFRLLLLLHLNATLCRYGVGVDEVHIINAVLKSALQC